MGSKWLRIGMLVAGCVLLAAGGRLFYLIYCGSSQPEIGRLPVSAEWKSGAERDRAAVPPDPVRPEEEYSPSVPAEPVAVPTPPVFAILTEQLPMGVVGSEYRQALEASGVEGPPAWNLAGGELAPGLTLSSAGVISGVPEESGEWRFTVRLAERGGKTARKELRLLVRESLEEEKAELEIVTESLAGGRLGRDYLQELEVRGGAPPYRWYLEGGLLPEGIRFNSEGGVIFGIPREVGSFPLTVGVTDDEESFATRDYTMSVEEEELELVTDALPPAVKGEPYSLTLRARGGVVPYAWELVHGRLPEGLNLDRVRGIVSGVPAKWETTDFVIRVTDREGRSAEKEFTLEVTTEYDRAVSYTGLRIVTGTLPNGVRGQVYQARLEAVGGELPYIWTVSGGELPPSLFLESDTGEIGGIPEQVGKFDFTVMVSDARRETARQEFSLTVNLQLVYITTGSLESAVAGRDYSALIEATGGRPPYAFRMEQGELPAGLSLGSDGLLHGIVSDSYFGQGPREFIFLVRADDQDGRYDIAEFRLSVRDTAEPTPLFSPSPPPTASPVPTASPIGLHISTESLDEGKVGVAYWQVVEARGGVEPYTWIFSGLPRNLSSSAAGVISGIPAAAGDYQVSVGVTDSQTASDSKSFSLVISEMEVEGISDLIGAPGHAKVGLAWTNPGGSDFAEVRVIRKTGGYPQSTADGSLVYQGSGNNIVDDQGLVNGTSYFYAVIAYNREGYPGKLEDGNRISLIPSGSGDPYADQVVGYYPLSSAGFGPTYVIGKVLDDDAREEMVAIQKSSTTSAAGRYAWLADGREAAMEQGPCGGGDGGDYCLQGFGGMADGTYSLFAQYNGYPAYINNSSSYYLFRSVYYEEDTYQTRRALGAPTGKGSYQGSTDVVSLQAKANDGNPPCGGQIVVRFTDNLVVNGDDADFTVFENVFYIGGDESKRFMEPAIVEVSQNGRNWKTFPCNYRPSYFSDGTVNFSNPFSYEYGFAGINPVFSNNGSPDPTNPAVSGGDSFDLDDLPGRSFTWIQYVRITSTGDRWLTDTDGDLVRHTDLQGALSGSGSSGFDLDAVCAVNY